MPKETKKTANLVFSVSLVVIILTVIASIIYLTGKHNPSDYFTEFYILDESGKAIDYTDSITVGEAADFTLGIVNHEYADISYCIESLVDGVSIGNLVYIVVQDGQKWEQTVAVSHLIPGFRQKIEFLLYKNDELLHQLYIWVDVVQ